MATPILHLIPNEMRNPMELRTAIVYLLVMLQQGQLGCPSNPLTPWYWPSGAVPPWSLTPSFLHVEKKEEKKMRMREDVET